MNNDQMKNEASFYWSVCILRRLRDMGLLSQREYEKIQKISADTTARKSIVSEMINLPDVR